MNDTKHHITEILTAAIVAFAVCWPHGRAHSQGHAQVQGEPPGTVAPSDDAGDPWDFAAPARALDEVFFDDSRGLTPEDAQRWFEPIEGQPLELVPSSNTHGRGVILTGMARLRAPWPSDAVLRLRLGGNKPCRLHFYTGREGILLYAYRSAHRRAWAAYRTTRRPDETMAIGDTPHVVVEPGLTLLATDDRRNARTIGGTYEIRHQDAALVLTKGGCRLLTVPLATPPEQVYLQGESLLLRGVAMFRGEPAPEQKVHQRRIVLQGERPAALRWEENLPDGARFERMADGCVQFTTKDTEALAWVSLPLMRGGLYEVVAKVEYASPGIGFYLAGENLRPVRGIGFVRDRRTGLTALGHDETDKVDRTRFFNVSTAPAPYFAPGQWIRLVRAADKLKCWISVDGRHWTPIADVGVSTPLDAVEGFWRRIGIYAKPGEATRRLKLGCLQVREFDAVTSLAPVELRHRAMELLGDGIGELPSHISDPAAWQQWVWQNQPPDVDTAEWQRACAIATLTRGPKPPLANRLLDGLADWGLSSAASVEDRLRLLDDVALLYDAWATEDALRLAGHYRRLGRDLFRAGDDRGFRVACRAMTSSPAWTQTGCIDPLDPDLARAELLMLVYRQKWEDAYLLCRQLAFHHRQANLASEWPSHAAGLRDLVAWAEPLAAGMLPERPGGRSPSMSADWQHPLTVYPSKEAYNTHAELSAAVADHAYRTACQVLTSASIPSGLVSSDHALIANPNDPRHFESLHAAVAALMSNHPGLQQMMRDEFGAVDQLRFQTAINEGDLTAIRGVTVRYHGTQAAAEAHCWLGDRLMVEGQLLPAISRYRKALDTASPSGRIELSGRIRLAGAMLGREIGDPTVEPVTFGNVTFTAGQFEQLTARIRSSHASDDGILPAAHVTQAIDRAPAPAGFQPRPWAQFNGDAGTEPEKVPGEARDLDWAGRQLATVLSQDLMIVSNRFQLVAYELATRKRKWTYSLGERQGPAHAWPMVPMRPQVVGGRVYARMLAERGRPEIVCLDLQTGRHLWTARTEATAVSDPLLLRGLLYALVTDPAANQPATRLMLSVFDPASGALLSERHLLELRNTPGLQYVCQAAAMDDKIVAVVAGSVFCLDTFGQIQWVRRETMVPRALDLDYAGRHSQPPLLSGDRVYVIPPNVCAVECIDLETGRLHWLTALPGAKRLLELSGDRLLIETHDGILAVSAETGRNLWHHHDEHLLDGYLPSGAHLPGSTGGLLCVRRESAGDGQSYPTLVWLDVETGRVGGRSPLRDLIGERPMLGPIVARDDRLWCFTGMFDEKKVLQPTRNIVELVAAGPAVPGDAETPTPWVPGVDPSLRDAADVVLPGWTLFSAPHDEKTGLQPQPGGTGHMLVTKADKTPVRLARRVKVPADGKASLSLVIGHEPETASRLRVYVGGIPVIQLAPGPTAAANQWQTHQIDLADYAGQQVWVIVVQRPDGNVPAYMYWKRLEVKP